MLPYLYNVLPNVETGFEASYKVLHIRQCVRNDQTKWGYMIKFEPKSHETPVCRVKMKMRSSNKIDIRVVQVPNTGGSLSYTVMTSNASESCSVPVLTILQHDTSLCKRFLSHLSPASVIHLGQTCTTAHMAVNNFVDCAFDIDRHFKAFFVNPLSFRSLQARTGTVVSGSNALQFFDRISYEGSDMDVYIHPGHALEVGVWLMKEEGYTFLPSNSQLGMTFENIVKRDDVDFTAPRSYNDHKGPPNARNYFDDYRFTGIDGMYNFVRIIDGSYKKIQVILTKYNPLDVILHFHSSEFLFFPINNIKFINIIAAVMNIIAFNAAYSLYPHTTFEERTALLMTDDVSRAATAMAKYSIRGWTFTHHPIPNKSQHYHIGKMRSVNDSMTWRIPLSLDGIQTRGFLSPTSPPFTIDPIQPNT